MSPPPGPEIDPVGDASAEPARQPGSEASDTVPEVPREVLDFVVNYGRPAHNNTQARNTWERDRLRAAKDADALKGIRLGGNCCVSR